MTQHLFNTADRDGIEHLRVSLTRDKEFVDSYLSPIRARELGVVHMAMRGWREEWVPDRQEVLVPVGGLIKDVFEQFDEGVSEDDLADQTSSPSSNPVWVEAITAKRGSCLRCY